jgi:hypothetical protein
MRSITLIIIASAAASAPALGQRGGSRRKTASTPVATTTAVPVEQVKEDCATKYMAALDKECYNASAAGGVYSDCSDKTIPELYDAMDMNLGRIVPYSELADTVKACSPYKGYAVEKWLSAKKVVETTAVKDSGACTFAKQKMAAAARCYSAALAHDGNFFEFENLMKQNCGQYQDVAQKFSKAGDLGFSNFSKMIDNWTTLQFTNKAENWKSSVEAVFVGYMYQAQTACGDADYEIIALNEFHPDVRENLLTAMRSGFYDQLGQSAARGVTAGATNIGAPMAVIVAAGAEKKNEEFYGAMGWKAAMAAKSEQDSEAEKKKTASYKLGNVYVIDGVDNANAARARVVSIVQNGSIGTAESQDDLDRKIIVALGGRAGGDPGIYNIVSAMSDGDTFIIKATGGMCQGMRLKNKTLIKLSNADIDAMPALYGHMSGCIDLES